MCGYCSIICTMELPTSHTKIPFSFRYSGALARIRRASFKPSLPAARPSSGS
ncbi:Uncharacterised protein [Vibrio cholerae]|nr:Uncharacterised protein [Vibrio cholerae]CSD17239.1 Uncharacterised protein [Vibrio cholerae]